jgi:protein-tyrosine phosphatase
MRILVVCLGNICRSPIAEGLFKKNIAEQNLSWTIDSAGTGSWHIGQLPDRRSIDICKQNGLDITNQRARQIRQSDFYNFDLILAMDHSNEKNLHRLKPADADVEIKKVMDYIDPQGTLEVPDPYYDGRFQEVYDLLEKAISKCLNDILVNQ